jgi:hypothetical protein
MVNLATIGCGGGGPSDDEKLVALSDSDKTDLCNNIVADETARAVSCADGSTHTETPITLIDCVARLDKVATEHPGCPATVGELQLCVSAGAAQTDAQLCANGSDPSECDSVDGSDCN